MSLRKITSKVAYKNCNKEGFIVLQKTDTVVHSFNSLTYHIFAESPHFNKYNGNDEN